MIRYLTISASAEVADAQRLVRELAPSHVVIWDQAEHGTADEDEDDPTDDLLCYVYPATRVRSLVDHHGRIGDVLHVTGAPADVRLAGTQWGLATGVLSTLLGRAMGGPGDGVTALGDDGLLAALTGRSPRQPVPAGDQPESPPTAAGREGADPGTPGSGAGLAGDAAAGPGGVPGPAGARGARRVRPGRPADALPPPTAPAPAPAPGPAPGPAPAPAPGPGPAREAHAAPEGPTLSAYAVAVDHPTSVPLGDPLSILLSISTDPAEEEAIPFAAHPGDVIDVVVVPQRGFVLDGTAEVRLTAGAEPGPARRVRLVADAVGPGEVVCHAFREGEPLGSLTIRPEVTPRGTPAGTGTSTAGTLPGRPGAATRADLELIVLEEYGPGGRHLLRYYLNATDPELGLNLKGFGPVMIQGSPAAYFAALYQDINDIPVDTANLRRLAAERLTAIGSQLFSDLFPQDLQVLLWGLRSRIASVLIQSQEAWIPWELCRLHGTEDGRVVEGEFLCEAFEVTRWLPALRRFPTLTATSIGVIQPPSDLVSAPQEALMLQGLAGPGRTVSSIPPTYTGVRAALAGAEHDAVHFVGHGRFPRPDDGGRAEIALTGTQVLRPIDISGVTRNLGLRTPIVFLNACQSGQRAVALTGNAGWALAMLGAGAGAFVGSHWDVTDTLALRFATEFYARVLAGDSVPAAARAARLTIRDDGDPTWLAYTLYADPQARVATPVP